ncbi:MAG: glycosyltransferase family 1 protein [Clostridiales bacterium]|nr:glycosyltransferase family 1 protein [Clostridiales bacterium]
MRIGINLLFLTNNTNTSIGKYTQNLLEGFRKINLLNSCYLFVRQCYYEKAKEDYPEATVVLIQAGKLSDFFLRHKKRHPNFAECYYLNRFVINSIAKKQQIDLLFYPFNDSTICLPKKLPHVFVIHDLYYLHYPEFYGRFHYLYAKQKHQYFLNHCNTIITISDFVKKEILSHLKTSKEPSIQVIPNTIMTASKFTDFTPVDEPYILSVASQTYSKNLITLFRAFNLIKKRIPHQLIIIGNRMDMTHELQSYVKQYNLGDRVLFLHDIPEEHLNSLYQNASLVVAPSLFESSGRVPIEAALLKTPVITSRSGVLPEVTLGLLSYYEPTTDCHSLAIKIIELLRDPPSEEVREQIAATYERKYNEVTVAKQYLSIFQPETDKSI